MIGTGAYLAASGFVLAYVVLTGWAAERLRTAADLRGGPAVSLLAWVVIALAISTLLGLLLGLVGAFGRWTLLGGAAATCLVAEAIWRRWGQGRRSDLRLPIEFDRWAMVASGIVLLGWLGGTRFGWDSALVGFDTLSYHMPIALSFAFEDGLGDYTFVDVSYLHHFYPAGSELLHAIGMSLVDRDLLSVFLNLGFGMVTLLAAWCLGDRLGSARVGLMAVVPLMLSGIMLRQQAGTASSDVPAVAMLVAAFALASTGLGADSRPRSTGTTAWLSLAGVAAGLAIGMKLTVGVPAAVLTAWVIFVGLRDRSARRGMWMFLVGLVVLGLPWELRNFILAGNPLPFIHGVGPIDLPSPARGFEGRAPFSVSHYLFNPDGSAVLDYFLPGLHKSLGWNWSLVLLLAAFGALKGLLSGSSRSRALGAAAVLGAFSYLITPFSAAGPEGFPVGFEWNLRYLAPAMALGLISGAGWAGGLDPRRRLSRWLPGFLLLLGIATTTTSSVLFVWRTLDAAWIAGAFLLALLAVVMLRRRPSLLIPVVVGAFGLGMFVIGLADRARYLERPTGETPSYYRGDLHLQAEASRLDGVEVGFTGQLAALSQYRLRGADFGTDAKYLGVEQPNGGFRAVRSCRELERIIRERGVEILIATPDRKSNSPLRYMVYSRVASSRPIARARFLEKYDTYGLVNYYRVLPDRRGCLPPVD